MGLHNYGIYKKRDFDENDVVIIAEDFPLEEDKENKIYDCLDRVRYPLDEKGYQYICETMAAIGISKEKRRELRNLIGANYLRYGCLD